MFFILLLLSCLGWCATSTTTLLGTMGEALRDPINNVDSMREVLDMVKSKLDEADIGPKEEFMKWLTKRNLAMLQTEIDAVYGFGTDTAQMKALQRLAHSALIAWGAALEKEVRNKYQAEGKDDPLDSLKLKCGLVTLRLDKVLLSAYPHYLSLIHISEPTRPY